MSSTDQRSNKCVKEKSHSFVWLLLPITTCSTLAISLTKDLMKKKSKSGLVLVQIFTSKSLLQTLVATQNAKQKQAGKRKMPSLIVSEARVKSFVRKASGQTPKLSTRGALESSRTCPSHRKTLSQRRWTTNVTIFWIFSIWTLLSVFSRKICIMTQLSTAKRRWLTSNTIPKLTIECPLLTKH